MRLEVDEWRNFKSLKLFLFSLYLFFFFWGGGGVRKKIGELTLFPAFFCLGVFLFCHHIIKEVSD